MRARKIGRVILNSTEDRPWSQYFCCMLAGNTDFIREHPVATKRVLRAASRPPIFALPIHGSFRAGWSKTGSLSGMTTRSRR